MESSAFSQSEHTGKSRRFQRQLAMSAGKLESRPVESGPVVGAKVLILTAVQIEARHVGRALGIAPPEGSGCTRGRLFNTELCLCLVGMKAGHLPALEPPLPDCIVLAGMAGALDPSLDIGDVIVDVRAEGCAIPPNWIAGTIHTSQRVVATPAEKQRLLSTTKALAVDMESGVVRKWAEHTGVPLVVIRSISDTADQTLDEDLLTLIDEYGVPSVGRIVSGLARHPMLAKDLVRLGRAARLAGQALGRAVRQFIEVYSKRPEGRGSPT